MIKTITALMVLTLIATMSMGNAYAIEVDGTSHVEVDEDVLIQDLVLSSGVDSSGGVPRGREEGRLVGRVHRGHGGLVQVGEVHFDLAHLLLVYLAQQILPSGPDLSSHPVVASRGFGQAEQPLCGHRQGGGLDESLVGLEGDDEHVLDPDGQRHGGHLQENHAGKAHSQFYPPGNDVKHQKKVEDIQEHHLGDLLGPAEVGIRFHVGWHGHGVVVVGLEGVEVGGLEGVEAGAGRVALRRD